MKFNRLLALVAALVMGSAAALTEPGFVYFTTVYFENKTDVPLRIENVLFQGRLSEGGYRPKDMTIQPGQTQNVLEFGRNWHMWPGEQVKVVTTATLPNGKFFRWVQTLTNNGVSGVGKISYTCVTIETPNGVTACLPSDQYSKFTADDKKLAVGSNLYTAGFTWMGLSGGNVYQDVTYSLVATGVVTPANNLKILQYNIQQRPSSEGLNYQVTGVHGERSYLSTVVLPQAIKPYDADIVTFNEAFTNRLRPELTANMAKVGYSNATDAVNANTAGGFWSGGVMVFSKYPIVKKAELLYSVGYDSDKSANKGAWYVQINKSGKLYNIFATHPNASYTDWIGGRSQDIAGGRKMFVNAHLRDDDGGRAARATQFQELRAFIDKQNIPADQPVIVVGDLNADSLSEKGRANSELEYIFKTLDVTAPAVHSSSFSYTYDIVTNPYVDNGQQQQWLDFALYSNRHQKPKKASMKAIALKAPQGTMWGSTNLSGKDLSDHYPMLAEFEF